MKKIDNYITEKLHINKGMKTVYDDSGAAEFIFDILRVYTSKNHENILNILNAWAAKKNVDTIYDINTTAPDISWWKKFMNDKFSAEFKRKIAFIKEYDLIKIRENTFKDFDHAWRKYLLYGDENLEIYSEGDILYIEGSHSPFKLLVRVIK